MEESSYRTPFVRLDGSIGEWVESEGRVYVLHPDRHPQIPDFGADAVLVEWQGRWITAVVLTGDLVCEADPTGAIRADDTVFTLFCRCREVPPADAAVLLSDHGYIPPAELTEQPREHTHTEGDASPRRGPGRRELTDREAAIWKAYDSLADGKKDSLYRVVQALKPNLVGIDRNEVKRVVDKVKARMKRDEKASTQ
jgi:hypothetical protein